MTDHGSSATNPSDPSGYLNPPQQVIKIINTARNDLNGELGIVTSFTSSRNRYTIEIPSKSPIASSPQSQQPTVLALKPNNMVAASFVEKMRFRANEIQRQGQMLYNDPNVRQQFQSTYNTVQNRLPPGVKPHYVAYGIAITIILSIYMFGFMKTILAISVVTMPLIVSAPDLLSRNSDSRSVIRNFPFRWRHAIVEMTGYTRLTERTAMIGFLVFMLVCAKVLTTPSSVSVVPPKSPSSTATANSSLSTSSLPIDATKINNVQTKLEQYYKLGFDDATYKQPFGHSLPSTISPQQSWMEDTTETRYNNNNDNAEFDWAYDTPPPSTKSAANKFGFGTMMALFTLVRTAKSLATGPDGNMNMELFVANAKTLDPMRMGLLGLSIYRLISVFLFQ